MRAVADALIDSNVVVALVAEDHEHHEASLAFFLAGASRRLAVAAHSYAEAFATLTRHSGGGAFRWQPGDAWRALEAVAAATVLIGLSAAQTLDTVRSYAEAGGVGARLYDRLIGQTAVQHGIARIVTWNVGHMRDLFPNLEVCNPAVATRA